MNLYECLKMYKKITLELIEEIKREEMNLDGLIEKRSEILDIIKEIKFSSGEFKEIVDSLGILKSEEELERLLKSEKVEVRKKIDVLRRSREAAKKYNKGYGFQNFFTARSK